MDKLSEEGRDLDDNWLPDFSTKPIERGQLPNPIPIKINHRKKVWYLRNNLYLTRTVLRVTQQWLAAEVGVSRQTISAIEAQRHEPSAGLALAIAQALKLNMQEIFKITPGYIPVRRRYPRTRARK